MNNPIKTICTLGLISALGITLALPDAFAATASPSNHSMKKQEVGHVQKRNTVKVAQSKHLRHHRQYHRRHHKNA